jgi:hypothetical protein
VSINGPLCGPRSNAVLAIPVVLMTSGAPAPRLRVVPTAGTSCRETRRPLSSYSKAELSALYKEFAEEDRELAALGIADFARSLEAEDSE